MHLKEWRQLHFRSNWGLRGMYWNVFLRSMGMALMGLFLPIFVFLVGYEANGITAGLRLVLVYLLIERVFVFIFNLSVGKLIEKIGFRQSILTGTLLSVLFFMIAAIFGAQVWVVMSMAVLSSFAVPLYWNSRFALLALEGEMSAFGKEQGLVSLLQRGAGVLAPAVGGVIISLWSFEVLFGLGAVVLLISAVPVFFMRQHTDRGGDHINWSDLKKFVFDKKERHLVLAFVGESWEGNVSALFWPIYLFLVLGSYEVLGGITAVALTLGLVMSFVAGWVFDKKNSESKNGGAGLFLVFSSGLAILRVLRAAFGSLWGVWGLDVVTKLTSSFYYVPYGGYLLKAGKGRKILKFFVYRETIYSAAAVLMVGMLWLVVADDWRWWFIFGLSAFGLLVSLFISRLNGNNV